MLAFPTETGNRIGWQQQEEGGDMANTEHFDPSTMPPGNGYTQVVKVGNTVYIAGQVSWAPDGSIVGVGDSEAQVRQIWRNIEAGLKSVGGSLSDLVKTTTFVTSMDVAPAVRKVRDELFQSIKPPTSAMIVISELARPEFVCEIEVIASVG